MNIELMDEAMRKIIANIGWLIMLKMYNQIEFVAMDGFTIVQENDNIFYEYPTDWSGNGCTRTDVNGSTRNVF